MEWHIQKHSVVSVDTTSPTPSKGVKKGTWHRDDGSVHEVEILDKNSIRLFSKWFLRTQSYFVETQDHILVLKDKRIYQDPSRYKETIVAFQTLGRPHNLVHIEEGLTLAEAQALDIKNKVTVKNFNGHDLIISYKKDQFGNTTLLARPITIHTNKGADPKILESILERLRAGTRIPGEATKPALPDLIKRAEETGRASILVAVDMHTLHRVTLLKNHDGSFSIVDAPALISEAEIDQAGIRGVEAKRLHNEGGTILAKLFDLAMNSSDRKAEYIFRSPTGTTDWSKRVILQIHIKDDGTVTFGLGSPLAQGGSKFVRKVVRFGSRIKAYAEATHFGRVEDRGKKATMEAEDLMHFEHPHILKLRKVYVRVPPTIDESRESALTPIPLSQTGLRTEFCDGGTAVSLTLNACTPGSKECLQRLQVAYDAAQALAYIHTRDQVDGSDEPVYAHMDFKPANLFIDGDPPVGIVGDINPQRVGVPAPTTPAYADFESCSFCSSGCNPPANAACDVWALGLTLFEFMYGKAANPFANQELNRRDEAAFRKAYEELINKLRNSPIDNLIRSMLQWDRKARTKLNATFLIRFEQVIAELREERAPSPFHEGPLTPKASGPSSPPTSPTQQESTSIARGSKSASFAASETQLTPPPQPQSLRPEARSTSQSS